MSFIKNARIMLVGFAIAQALPLLASPLLTRLFTPEAFGLQTVFISAVTILAVLATLRLDLAIVLAEDRDDAQKLVSLVGLQVIVVVALIGASALFLGPFLARIIGHPSQIAWIWGLAPMVAALAAVQTITGLLTWSKRFGPSSQAQVLNQGAYLAAAVAIGMYATSVEGLVAAKLLGQVVAAGLLLMAARDLMAGFRFPGRTERSDLWRRYRPFLLFNTPYSLIGALGREVPIFAFSAVAATATAGYYGLARTLLGAPATLLAASLSQVFYREATENRGTASLQRLTVNLLRATMWATAPIFAFLIAWGDIAFGFVFGPAWVTAGQYAMVLATAAWLGIQTAWPERLYESVGRQGTSFAIQVGFDVSTALIVFGSVFADLPRITTVVLFAGINSLFHMAYLTGMFRVAGFPLILLVRTVGSAFLILLASTGIMAALRWLPLPQVWDMMIAAGVSVCCGGVLAIMSYRVIHRSLAADAK